jgi:hypothetical protein
MPLGLVSFYPENGGGKFSQNVGPFYQTAWYHIPRMVIMNIALSLLLHCSKVNFLGRKYIPIITILEFMACRQ